MSNWESVFHYSDPSLCYETNEFIVERDPATGRWRYGDDGGCSCYGGFSESNFTETYDYSDVSHAFTRWASTLHDTARAQEAFRSAVPA